MLPQDFVTASLCVPKMSSPNDDSSSTDSSSTESYEPQANKHHEAQNEKQKMLIAAADRADKLLEKHLVTNQPERVPLSQIMWHPANRRGQGILPLHVHNVARDTCTNGRGNRRYGQVKLVEVPENVRTSWLSANLIAETTRNPRVANFLAMSHTGWVYATLSCTHLSRTHFAILSRALGPIDFASSSKGSQKGYEPLRL